MEEGITTGYLRHAGIAEGGVRIAISVSKNISSVGNVGSVGFLAARAGSTHRGAISLGLSIRLPLGCCAAKRAESGCGLASHLTASHRVHQAALNLTE